jgi:hypothetical protein
VNSDRIDVQLPSLICEATIVKDPRRTNFHHSFSFRTPGTAEKLPYQIMYRGIYSPSCPCGGGVVAVAFVA